MSTVMLVLRLSFWGSAAQRVCTLAGFGLALGASLLNLLLGEPLRSAGARFVSPQMATWGVMIACLPLLVQAGPMWRAVSSQRAVLLAPRGRRRLFIAALAVAAAAALFMSAFNLLAQAPWIIRLALRSPAEAFWAQYAAVQWSLMFATSFVLATWWGIGAFWASRSPLAALVLLVGLVAVGLGMPLLAAHLVDPTNCLASAGALCTTAASLRGGGGEPPFLHFKFALAVWGICALWYLNARRIAPPGWLLAGGQSLLAATTVGHANAPLARSAAIEHLLFGGSSIGRLLAQWLLAGLLLLAMLLLLSRQVDDSALVAWVLRATLVIASGIVLALSLAARRRARALWLPAALDRTQVHDLVRNGLLKLALGLTLVAAMFLVAQWYALPWPGGLSLPQALVALLAANLLWVALVLYRASGWAHLAVSGGALMLLYFGFAAPLVRNAPGNWGWLTAMLVAAAALLLLARRRWMNSDLPSATTAPAF
ncbi:MAG TPA: hypothetical protein VMK82_00175 [Steroidobacteraceae bacterium]|nr:hypothetical protein [Steroidobacteraceae bacterium]